MILRKPYAVLIKYFKPIHIFMFVSFGYLVFVLRKIYIFFSNYIKLGSFTYVENMVNRYVPWISIILVVILLGLSIGILLLMNKKEKPVLFYKIMITYSVFLIVMLIYYMIFFKSLDNTIYEPLRIAVNRDIVLFAYIFNYFFVIFNFIRGFGFDIKKFSFDRDKKELNLEESDSEEYELNVNLEKEDIKSFLNRHKRELKNYIKENKVFFIVVGTITFVSISLYFGYDYFVVNKVYNEGDTISVGDITYRINNSRISNMDKYGQELGLENDYLIVDLSFTSNGKEYLDNEALRVHIGDDYYYPSISSCDLFSDLGVCFKNQKIDKNSDNNYIFVYKIKKEYSDIYIEILKSKGEEYKYSKVKLAYNKDKIEDTYKKNRKFVTNDYSFKIDDYSITNKTSYQYEDCSSGKCITYTKGVMPNTGEMVLALKINNIEKISDDFLNSAIGVKYISKIYTGRDIKLIDKNSDYLYYSVPIFVKTGDSFDLIVTVRPNRYHITLGGLTNE